MMNARELFARYAQGGMVDEVGELRANTGGDVSKARQMLQNLQSPVRYFADGGTVTEEDKALALARYNLLPAGVRATHSAADRDAMIASSAQAEADRRPPPPAATTTTAPTTTTASTTAPYETKDLGLISKAPPYSQQNITETILRAAASPQAQDFTGQQLQDAMAKTGFTQEDLRVAFADPRAKELGLSNLATQAVTNPSFNVAYGSEPGVGGFAAMNDYLQNAYRANPNISREEVQSFLTRVGANEADLRRAGFDLAQFRKATPDILGPTEPLPDLPGTFTPPTAPKPQAPPPALTAGAEGLDPGTAIVGATPTDTRVAKVTETAINKIPESERVKIPQLDTEFRASAPRTPIYDRFGRISGYTYTPAAKLTPATGTNVFNFVPPGITSRPRSLLNLGDVPGVTVDPVTGQLRMPLSASQQFARDRSELDNQFRQLYARVAAGDTSLPAQAPAGAAAAFRQFVMSGEDPMLQNKLRFRGIEQEKYDPTKADPALRAQYGQSAFASDLAAAFDPFLARNRAALTALASQQAPKSYSEMYPDIAEAYAKLKPEDKAKFPTLKDYELYHFDTYGRKEGRTSPLLSMGALQSPYSTAFFSKGGEASTEDFIKKQSGGDVSRGTASPETRGVSSLKGYGEGDEAEYARKSAREIFRALVGMDPYDKTNPTEAYRIASTATPLTLIGGGIKGIKGVGKGLSRAEQEANLAKFLEPSQVKERLYHGSHKPAIIEFQTGRMLKEKQYPGNTIESWAVDNRDAVFLTPDPKLADSFAGSDFHIGMGYTPAIYPVRVQVKNPWDYDNPEHIESVIKAYKEKYPLKRTKDGVPSEESMRHHRFETQMRELPLREKANWSGIEKADVQEIIRDLGHDGFFVKEGGVKNLGVYDPRRIKSDLGNEGTYDTTSPDINKAKGGEVSTKDFIAKFADGSPNPDEVPSVIDEREEIRSESQRMLNRLKTAQQENYRRGKLPPGVQRAVTDVMSENKPPLVRGKAIQTAGDIVGGFVSATPREPTNPSEVYKIAQLAGIGVPNLTVTPVGNVTRAARMAAQEPRATMSAARQSLEALGDIPTALAQPNQLGAQAGIARVPGGFFPTSRVPEKPMSKLDKMFEGVLKNIQDGPDDEKKQALMALFNQKAKDFYTKQASSIDDPLRQDILSGRIRFEEGTPMADLFPNQLQKGAAKGDLQSLRVLEQNYDRMIGLKATIPHRQGLAPTPRIIETQIMQHIKNNLDQIPDAQLLAYAGRKPLPGPVGVAQAAAKVRQSLKDNPGLFETYLEPRIAKTLFPKYTQSSDAYMVKYPNFSPNVMNELRSPDFVKPDPIDSTSNLKGYFLPEIEQAIEKNQPIYDIDPTFTTSILGIRPDELLKEARKLPQRELERISFPQFVKKAFASSQEADERKKLLEQVPKLIKEGKAPPEKIMLSGTKTFLPTSEGFKWIKVTDPDAVVAIAKGMDNSVASYATSTTYGSLGKGRAALERGEAEIYSLYDKNNVPHMTVEYLTDKAVPPQDRPNTIVKNTIAQFTGNGPLTRNQDPSEQYIPHIKALVDKLNPSKVPPDINLLLRGNK